jgi:hypothetical protein
MKITLTNEKAKAIVLLGNEILQKELVVIRKLAQLIGNLVASELGVNYAPLYYKVLEIEKDDALKQNYGNFEAKLKLSDNSFCKISLPSRTIAFAFSFVRVIFISTESIQKPKNLMHLVCLNTYCSG